MANDGLEQPLAAVVQELKEQMRIPSKHNNCEDQRCVLAWIGSQGSPCALRGNPRALRGNPCALRGNPCALRCILRALSFN